MVPHPTHWQGRASVSRRRATFARWRAPESCRGRIEADTCWFPRTPLLSSRELDSQALNDRSIIPEYYPSRILGGEKAGLLLELGLKPSKRVYVEVVLTEMEER